MIRRCCYRFHCVGIGLLELMLSLAIIAILLIGATRFYQSTRVSQQVNDAVGMLQTVITASESWFYTLKTFQSIPLLQLVGQGLVPSSFGDNTANPWGGEIQVASGADPDKQIQLSLTQVPVAACKGLQDIMTKKGVHNQRCLNNHYTGVYP